MACQNHPAEVVGLVECARCGKEFCRDCVVELKERFYCADCKREQVKDIQSGSDGTEMALASIGSRFVAQFIDGLVFMVPAFVIVFAVILNTSSGGPSRFAEQGSPLVAIYIPVVFLFIGLVYEGAMLQARGQTLGKMAMGLKVVLPDGSDIGAGHAWTRAFVRSLFAAGNIIVGVIALLDYIPALISKEKKCIHDMAAGTRVVKIRG